MYDIQNDLDEQIEMEETVKEEDSMNNDETKLKYSCPKCNESFSLKVDLKVRFYVTV